MPAPCEPYQFKNFAVGVVKTAIHAGGTPARGNVQGKGLSGLGKSLADTNRENGNSMPSSVPNAKLF
jgi:hypothetical protein